MLNPDRVSNKDVDLEEIVWKSLLQFIAEARAQQKGVQTFGVYTLLRGLKAAYGVMAIKQATLTPWNALYQGDDNLMAWLKKHGYAQNDEEAREIVEVMKKYIEHKGDAEHLVNELENGFNTLEQEQHELTQMENELKVLEAGGG